MSRDWRQWIRRLLPASQTSLGEMVRIGRQFKSSRNSLLDKQLPQSTCKKNVIVIGGGGHARVVADAIQASADSGLGIALLGFLDDDPTLVHAELLGKPVLGKIHELEGIPHDAVALGIGDNDRRRELFELLRSRGENFISVIHPRAVIAPDVKIGQGMVAFAGVVVNTGSQIADNVILNTGSTVDHDCIVGAHAHICPGVHLGGTVCVGEGAFVGIGSAVIQNRNIGAWSVIGAGSAVIRDVPDRTTVVGVPARNIEKQSGRVCKQANRLRIVSADSTADWRAALTGAHDFYHLPFYSNIARDLDQGEPNLIVYRNGDITICLPLLIRRIDHIPTDGLGKEVWYDASSVYGYAGPVASHSSVPEPVRIDFQQNLIHMLSQMRVVSVFSRLHPLINQEHILDGLGNVVFQGHTVSMDLTIPEELQLAKYRENHRRGLKKLKQAGATCFVDEEFRNLDRFIEIYSDTMKRVGATAEYVFPRSYFTKLKETQEAEVKLIVCMINSELACAGIFVKCGEILQYHLGGSSNAWLKLSPMKLVLDAARHWGCLNGAKVFHLGGGVSTQDDSLFQFKLGFSDTLHAFKTWRWILFQSVYDQLVTSLSSNRSCDIRSDKPVDFFPRYRSANDSLQIAFHDPDFRATSAR